jgi:hypothetical protein
MFVSAFRGIRKPKFSISYLLLQILFVYVAQGVAMFMVCILQFFNPMIISGLLLSFLASCITVMQFQVTAFVYYGPLYFCVFLLLINSP